MKSFPPSKNLVTRPKIGLVAGWLASFVVGGSGLVRYLISGVIGSFVGSFLFSKAGIHLGIGNEILRDILYNGTVSNGT